MARSTWLSAAAIAALAIGCGTSGTGDTGSESIKVPVGPAHHQPPPPPPEACRALGAPGSIVSNHAIAGGEIVAVDAHGDVFYTAERGIVKQTSAGAPVYAFPFGSVFAIDADGNAYVAGSFTAPIDLGNGTLNPIGNIDVFVAKLSPRGQLIFAEQLGLCGDGVESIAVSADGRIAVSGTAMGTAILDASGKLLEQVFYAGHLAFDSHGNLYVAGSFTGSLALDSGHVLSASSSTDVDAFLVELDLHGDYVRSFQLGDLAGSLPTSQVITGIATGAGDSVAFVGSFDQQIDLLGHHFTALARSPWGAQLGSFVVKLDASGSPIFVDQMSPIDAPHAMGGVAIDKAGNVLVSTNFPSNELPLFVQSAVVDFNGTLGLPRLSENFAGSGYGLGVAADACGNIWFASFEAGGGATLRQIVP